MSTPRHDAREGDDAREAREPHGPEQLPDRQPMRGSAAEPGVETLRTGATSRWLVPAAALAVIATVLFVIALQLQVLLPVLGIVYVVLVWIVMLVVARTTPARKIRNRRLAVLSAVMGAGAVLFFIGLYVMETVGA